MPVPYADRFPFRRIAAWSAGTYWLALLLIMHVPLKREPKYLEATFVDADKLTHLGAYGLFAALLCWAFDERRQLSPEARPRSRIVGLLGVIAFLAAYGIIDERTQPWTGRDCNLPDYIADVIGATLGTIAYALWTWRRCVAR